MAVTAESVVVELVAKTDGYSAAINGAATTTTTSMSKIEQSASRAERQIVRSSGAIANAQRNLGRQVSDIGTQLAGGQSPFLILAQQAPQVADALADTGGRAAQVASFFAGPWGAALLAAGSALGVLVGKMMETGDTVESLVAKLRSNEERTKLAAEADRIFAGTQAGLSSRIRATTDALNEQNASLRTNAQLRNVRARAEADDAQKSLSEASQRLADANRRIASFSGAGVGTDASLNAVRRSNRAELDRAREEARQAREDAQRATINVNRSRVFLAREQARQDATPEGRLNRRFDNLADTASRSAIAAAERGAQVGARTLRALTTIEERRNRAIDSLRDSEREDRRRGGTGPSQETLMRRAEVERIREIRTSEAYNNDLEQLNSQILALKRQAAVDAGEIAILSREEVASEQRKKLSAIDADEKAGKYDALEAEALREKAREVASLKNLAISTDEIRRAADEQLAASTNALNRQGALLDAQGRIADTQEQRKAIELQLLQLKYDELRIAREAVTKDTTGRFTDAQRREAQRDLDAIPGMQRAEQAGIDRRYEGRFERYRREVLGADALSDSIDGIKIQTLESVTDELTNATKAALGLKGAFGDIVGELIRIGIQRKLIGPLADALFGKQDGSTSGSLNGLLSSLSGFFGRASGGYVGPGQTVRVNEGRGGVELLRMGSQGGTVIPLGQANATAQPMRPQVTVIAPQQFDLRGVFLNEQTLRQLEDRNRQYADAVGQSVAKGARREFPAAQTRFSQLGTTG